MNIKISMRGQKEIIDFLSILPRGVKIAAMSAYAEYLIGDESHGLKYNPPRVTHDADNPYLWQSEKQRRAFFATDGFGGGIPHERTGETTNAWTLQVKDSNWTSAKIVNDSPGAYWVQGEGQQRGHKADGWRRDVAIIASNAAGAMSKAIAAVQAWLQLQSKK